MTVSAADIRRAEALGRKLERAHFDNLRTVVTHNRVQKMCRVCKTMKTLVHFPDDGKKICDECR